jgi:hypothetical protein
MGLLGELLALPVRVLNIPNRAIEKLVDPDSKRDDDSNVLSRPLEALAQVIEEITDDRSTR